MPTNKYVNTSQAAGAKVLPGVGFPGQVLVLAGTYEKTASDNDASVLRLGKVPSNARPLVTLSRYANDALTGATDIDIGLYKPGANGAVVDKDCLSDGLNIASGAALGSEARAFQAVGIEEWNRTLKQIVESDGSTTIGDEEFDVAITGNTFGTAAGTISWELYFLIPQA
jgi:hypothetical protein